MLNKKYLYSIIGCMVIVTGILVGYYGVIHQLFELVRAGDNSIIAGERGGRYLPIVVLVGVILIAGTFCIIVSGYTIVKIAIRIHVYPKITITPFFFILSSLIVGFWGALFVLPDKGAHGLAGLRFFLIELPIAGILFFIGFIKFVIQKDKK